MFDLPGQTRLKGTRASRRGGRGRSGGTAGAEQAARTQRFGFQRPRARRPRGRRRRWRLEGAPLGWRRRVVQWRGFEGLQLTDAQRNGAAAARVRISFAGTAAAASDAAASRKMFALN